MGTSEISELNRTAGKVGPSEVGLAKVEPLPLVALVPLAQCFRACADNLDMFWVSHATPPDPFGSNVVAYLPICR